MNCFKQLIENRRDLNQPWTTFDRLLGGRCSPAMTARRNDPLTTAMMAEAGSRAVYKRSAHPLG